MGTKPFDLAVTEWWKVPRVGNSRLADVYVSPAPAGTQDSIMASWCSACVDPTRKDLDVFGGGHLNYAGNEVYAFNFDPASGNYLLWRVKNFYSTAGAGDTEAASGGGAASRHTYSVLDVDPVRDVMIVGPGGALYGSSGNFGSGTWEFKLATESPSSFDASAWTQVGSMSAFPTGTTQHNFVWAPTQFRGWLQWGGLGEWNPFLPSASQWAQDETFESNPLGDSITATYIPSTTALTPNVPRRALLGAGGLCIRQLVGTGHPFDGTAQNNFGTSGATAIEAASGPGCVWDDNLGKLVAWAGTLAGGTDNRDAYFLDLGTKVWTRTAGTGDTPDAPTTNGTFGRFRNLNGCGAPFIGLNILVNSTTSDVYFYRSSAAPGPGYSTQPTSISAYNGDTAQFTIVAVASDGGSISAYQWQVSTDFGVTWNNVSSGTGGTTASFTTAALAFSDDQTFYRCQATDANGTTSSAAASLRINPRATGAWVKA